MIIAAFTAFQFYGTIAICVLFAVVLTYVVTREFGHSSRYTQPSFRWQPEASNTITRQVCEDYRGNAVELAYCRMKGLGESLNYITIWNHYLLGENDHLLAQPNGEIFYSGSLLQQQWSRIQRPQKRLPILLEMSASVKNAMIDGIDLAHHYQRLLTVGLDDTLAILRLPSDSSSAHPWLLIYQTRTGNRSYLKLGYAAEVSEASRVAVLHILHGNGLPNEGFWENATPL